MSLKLPPLTHHAILRKPPTSEKKGWSEAVLMEDAMSDTINALDTAAMMADSVDLGTGAGRDGFKTVEIVPFWVKLCQLAVLGDKIDCSHTRMTIWLRDRFVKTRSSPRTWTNWVAFSEEQVTKILMKPVDEGRRNYFTRWVYRLHVWSTYWHLRRRHKEKWIIVFPATFRHSDGRKFDICPGSQSKLQAG